MMPLTKQRNLKKGDKIIPMRGFHQEHRLRIFFKENDVKEDIDTFLTQYSEAFNNAYSI